MNTYYMPINLENFNLIMKRVDEVEDFQYKEGMEVGDCLLLYVSQKGIEGLKAKKPKEYELCAIKESGFYGMARIISLPYESPYKDDYLKKRIVIDAKITILSKDEPILKYKVSQGVKYTQPQEIDINVSEF